MVLFERPVDVQDGKRTGDDNGVTGGRMSCVQGKGGCVGIGHTAGGIAPNLYM